MLAYHAVDEVRPPNCVARKGHDNVAQRYSRRDYLTPIM
jgi:hypothetical protein